MNFGKKLVEVRKAKGLTQDEVAEMCKITTRSIQRIESGEVTPRAFTIKTISAVLEFDFFEASNTGYETNQKNRYSKLKLSIKNLFNLKTNAMKKVFILATSCLITGFFIFVLIPNANAEPPKHPNYINTKERVEVAFTHELTLDSLIFIKNDLANRGILLHYKNLEFDDTSYLVSIDCEVVCEDGFKGSFYVNLLNIDKKRYGFYRDYSKKAKSPFGTGCINCK